MYQSASRVENQQSKEGRYDELNQQQMTAVTAEGDLYVSALPGTGKTKTLCLRIAFLVLHKNVRPDSILAISFSRKAVMDIRRQLAEVFEDRPALAKRIHVTTFHSLMLKVLRSSNFKNQIISKDWEKSALLQPILRKHDLDEEAGAEALSILSLAKNKAVPLHKITVENDEEKLMLEVMKEYEKAKSEKEKMDFDDIMVLCLMKLATDRRMADLLQRSFSHILIDESQDLCRIQIDFLKFLKGDNTNFSFFGDEFQAIYGFRGAEPRNMLSLQKLLNRPTSVKLSINYRSSPPILALANNILAYEGVKLQAHKDGGQTPLLLSPNDRHHEADMITQVIRESPFHYKDQCVLTRTGDYIRPLIENLVRQGIPLNLQGDMVLLYEQPKVKPLMAHLRMMAERQRKGDLRLILKLLQIHPWKHQALLSGQGKAAVSDLVNSQQLDPHELERVLDLLELYDQLLPLPPNEVVQALRTDHYDGFLMKGLPLLSEKRLFLMDKMQELEEALATHPTLDDALNFLENLSASMGRQDPAGITIMTLHGSKGLEFPAVILPGIVEGQLPHQRSLTESQVLFRSLHQTMAENLSEEKRLAFVGTTRAMDTLVISSPRQLNGKPAEVSRFVFPGLFYAKKKEVSNHDLSICRHRKSL